MERQQGYSPLLRPGLDKWTNLAKQGQVVTYPKGSITASVSTVVNKLYCILEGSVKITILDKKGNERILYIVGKGGLFGEGPIFTKALTNTNTFAVALEKCKICEFTYVQVTELIKKWPELSIEIIKSMTYKMEILINQLESVSFKCSQGKIADLIYRMANNYGTETRAGIKLYMDFTHDELAKLAGCSRVSVSRVLSALKSQGIISYRRKYIIIKHPKKLQEIATQLKE